MLISNYTFQNVYPQTGNFFFEVDVAVPSLTGSCSFGFSGDQGCFDFNLTNGKVFYPNHQIMSYYNAGEKINISGFVTPTSGLVAVRDKAFNILKTGNAYNYFYINPVNCTADISVTINGETPTWTLDSSGCFKSGEPVNFDILFDESQTQFRIFSGQVVFPSGFGMSGINEFADIVSGSTFQVLTENLVYQASGAGAVYPLIMIFNTNYGNVTQNYTIFKYDNTEQKFTVIPSDSPVILEKNSYQVFNVKALDLTASGFQNVPVTVNFNHISGSGIKVYEFDSTVTITGGRFVSGFVFGSGFITGLYTGSVPGTGCVTGNIPVTGTMSVAAYGGSGFFTITGFGIGSGVAWGNNSTYVITGVLTAQAQMTGTLNQWGYDDVSYSGAVFSGCSYDPTAQILPILFSPTDVIRPLTNSPYYIPRNSLDGRCIRTLTSGQDLNSFGTDTIINTGIQIPGFASTYNGGDGPDTSFANNIDGIIAGHSGFRFISFPVTTRIFHTGVTVMITGVPVFSGTGYLLNTISQPSVLYSGNFEYNQIYAGTGITTGNNFPISTGSGFTGQYYIGSYLQNKKTSGPICLTGYRGSGFITQSSQSGSTIGANGRAFNLVIGSNATVWGTSGGANTGWVQFDMRSGANSNWPSTFSDLSQPSTFGCNGFHLQGYVVVSAAPTGVGGTPHFYSGAIPKTWDVSGSNDNGVTWTLIDSQSGIDPAFVSFFSSPNGADTQRGPQWLPTDTGYYQLFRFNFYQIQDPSSTQMVINSINMFGYPRIYADTTSGLSDSHGWKCSGNGFQTDGNTITVTGVNFISGTAYNRGVTFRVTTGATGHVPCRTEDQTFGDLGIERYPGVPATGLITGSQNIFVSGGRILGPNIISGSQTFYNRVWRTYVETGLKFQPYQIVYYSGGQVLGTETQGTFGYVTGFISGVPNSLVLTGSSTVTMLKQRLSGSGAFVYSPFNVLGARTILTGDVVTQSGYQVLNYSTGNVSVQYTLPYNGSAYLSSQTLVLNSGNAQSGITFDYWDYGFNGLVINPTGSNFIPVTGGAFVSPVMIFVSGYESLFALNFAQSGYSATRHPILISGYVSGVGAYVNGIGQIWASGILPYYGFIPTGTQVGTTFLRDYIIDSGIIQYTQTLDKSYYVGTRSGYSVDPTPMYYPRTFFSGKFGYVESGFLYNDTNNIETRPYTGAYNYYPTGLHGLDFNSSYNYPFSISGSQILVRVPLYGIPAIASGVGGETLTGRYSGLNYSDSGALGLPLPNLTNKLALTGTLGSGIRSGYASGVWYDQNMMQNFIGFSTNTVLINASGFVILEFSGDIQVSGLGFVANDFPTNWKVYSGALQPVFNEGVFFGTSTTTGQAISFNDQGWYTPTSIYNGPTGGSIYGNYVDGFTMAVVYTGSCATGYTAQLIVSGLPLHSGYIINFSGKDV